MNAPSLFAVLGLLSLAGCDQEAVEPGNPPLAAHEPVPGPPPSAAVGPRPSLLKIPTEIRPVDELRVALEASPDDPQAQMNLGWTLVQERILAQRHGEPLPPASSEGRDLLREALVADPYNSGALFVLGRDYELQGELDLARRCMESAAELNPTFYVLRTALGKLLIRMGEYAEAERVLRSVIDELEGEELSSARQNRQDAIAYLATALAFQGKNEEAERMLRAASDQATDRAGASNEPNFACTHMALGELFRNQGRDEDAARYLVQAADLEPEKSIAQYHAARQLYFNGKHEQAATYIQRAIALEDLPSYRSLEARVAKYRQAADGTDGAIPVDALLVKAGRALEAMDFVLAHELTSRALERDTTTQARVLEGFMLVLQHDYDGARQVFAAAARQESDNRGATVGLAHVALASGENERTRQLLAPLLEDLRSQVTGVTQIPEGYDWIVYAMAQLGMGWSHANDTNHELALLHFDAVLDYHSKSVIALVGKGNSLNALGRLEEAEHELRHVLQLQPDNPYAHAELGTVLLARGDDNGAEQAFESALEVEPTNYTCPHEGLGLVMLRQGRTDDAKAAFEKAIEINPNIEYRKYNELARIHIAEGDLDEARRLLEKSVANFPHDPEAAEMLAGLEGGAP